MTSQHRYNLAGAITAPVRDPYAGNVIGIATIEPDGKITAQLHDELFTKHLRDLLTMNLADGFTIEPKLIKAREEEKHDSNPAQ